MNKHDLILATGVSAQADKLRSKIDTALLTPNPSKVDTWELLNESKECIRAMQRELKKYRQEMIRLQNAGELSE